MKVILDTNVVLDTLMKREGLFQAAYEVVKLSIQNKIQALLPASVITDIHYIMSQSDKTQARPVLEQFVGLIAVCDVTPADVGAAFASEMDDFEGAVLAAVAARVHADYIVTRNKRDFVKSPVPVATPEELLALCAGL
ncbi:MAG: PIN domain-containing protein [Oscillospiraceae bacterium]|jgi:predicted nucleic acid-binding protein|nr:PIN domain-containing protein [Oscillospiraceae bacterium]